MTTLLSNEQLLEFIASNPTKTFYFSRDIKTGLSEVFTTRQEMFYSSGMSDGVFKKLALRPWVHNKGRQMFSSKMLSSVSTDPMPFSRKTFMRGYAYHVKTFAGLDDVFYGSEGVERLAPYLNVFNDSIARLRGVQFTMITQDNCDIEGADRSRIAELGLLYSVFDIQEHEYNRRIEISKTKVFPEFNKELELA